MSSSTNYLKKRIDALEGSRGARIHNRNIKDYSNEELIKIAFPNAPVGYVPTYRELQDRIAELFGQK
jgi:hypothetical protein